MNSILSHIHSIHYRRIFCLILLFAFIGCNVYGQKEVPNPDSSKQVRGIRPQLKEGSFEVEAPEAVKKNNNSEFLEHSPRKAMIYSLSLPGLGQIYNKKYFKIPFVYAALGGVGYWVYYNNKGYQKAIDNYNLDKSELNILYIRRWRRYLEISYIATVGVYALQVLDAYVDANLYYWDVSPDLSLKMGPAIDQFYTPLGNPAVNYGFKCILSFK